jgi:hypothetical protein
MSQDWGRARAVSKFVAPSYPVLRCTRPKLRWASPRDTSRRARRRALDVANAHLNDKVGAIGEGARAIVTKAELLRV